MPEPGGEVTFVLDGRPTTAAKGEMLIAAAERAGVFIPRFCYHPRMKPVGMCRMCLVEVAGPRGASLQPACFIAAAEGMEVSTTSERVHKAQDGVLEFLLVNHPLDCPVCDKGGECPLQDQTLAYGPGESRFVEEKRHFEKPIALSELVLLDRERCIQCGRCTRFAEEIAGEAQIDFAGRGEHVEVATFPTEPFSSYFSGNTVQICPVGALTSTPYRFSARPWDLEQVESTCTTCAFGCRVAVQSSGNRLTRLLGIDSDPVNQGWLCDKGRYVFEAVNGDTVAADGPGQFGGEAHRDPSRQVGRLTEPLVRKDDELVPVSWGEALAAAARGLHEAREGRGAGAVAVLGGAQLTNEGAYAWAKLAKSVLRTDAVDAQLGDGLPADLVLGLPLASVDETCAARTVVLLTGDLREELPVLYLRLRGAALAGSTRLLELSPAATPLTPYSEASLRNRPGDAPALARALVGDVPADAPWRTHHEGAPFSDADLAVARRLLQGDGPAGTGVVVVLGRPSMAEDPALQAEAARVLAESLPGARFLPALRRGNVRGALDMGLAPGCLPGRVSLEAGRPWFDAAWGGLPERPGRDAASVLASLAGAGGTDEVRAVILLGADPVTDFPDGELATKAVEGAQFVVVVTGHRSATVERADVVLPAAVAHERSGTTTNVEGRVQRLSQKLVPPGSAWADWVIAAELADALGADLGFESASDLWDEIERLAPAYAGVTRPVLESAGDGVLVPLARHAPALGAPIDPIALPGVESVERQGAPPSVGSAEVDENEVGPAALAAPSGGPAVLDGPGPVGEPVHVPPADHYAFRLLSPRRLYDGGSAVSASPSLAGLVEEAEARLHPLDLDRLGVGRGDRVRVRSARVAFELAAAPDDGLPRGVVAVDFLRPAGGERNAAAALIDGSAVVNDVRVETL